MTRPVRKTTAHGTVLQLFAGSVWLDGTRRALDIWAENWAEAEAQTAFWGIRLDGQMVASKETGHD